MDIHSIEPGAVWKRAAPDLSYANYGSRLKPSLKSASRPDHSDGSEFPV
ncbi:hypothetical protein CSB93_1606 [Pseudomonas paraeruginosa]|uniref:Uncharacterized protein n=1 Tax=Pseudomonas paraeruginosa TaxID=2994495 RepID=A0A2R3IUD5_9PSED|nr:hypothetical protein CSB93_1606 [Pseudomonas paraeruginosa]AWE89958.1 hypothetical protein CSC28_0374 [Pseudomonas paraeruginosa]